MSARIHIHSRDISQPILLEAASKNEWKPNRTKSFALRIFQYKKV